VDLDESKIINIENERVLKMYLGLSMREFELGDEEEVENYEELEDYEEMENYQVL